MNALSLNPNGPTAFILAADGEFSEDDLQNDQVWTLDLERSDTCPFHLQTTYQLRARSMRLFPNLISGNRRLTKTSDFLQPVTVSQYTPGFIQINYTHANSVKVQFDCFIAQPDVMVGGISIQNMGPEPVNMTLKLAAVLVPLQEGFSTRPENEGINQIIVGRTEDLWPLMFMTGGPTAVSSPFPALSTPIQLSPLQSRTLTWALAAKDSRSSSLDTVRKITATPWQKSAQKQVMHHARRTIYIHTGDPDWDASFYLAQMNALTHRVSTPRQSKNPSFIRTRIPDKTSLVGQSREKKGEITALDVNHLAQILLPAHSKTLTAMVEKFFDRIDENGRLPSQLALSSLEHPFQECPVLANLCLELYQINQDHDFLQRVYPHLALITKAWMARDDACDDNLSLAWENPRQLQLDTGLFAFDIWEKTGRGLDINTAQSPALAGLLLRETQALEKIAQHLENEPAQKQHHEEILRLKRYIKAFWSDEQNSFGYLDRQSLKCPSREIYYPGPVQPLLKLNKHFISPQRLQLHLYSSDQSTRAGKIRFAGESPEGNPVVEAFKPVDIRWVMGRAHLTTQKLYGALHTVSFEGLKPEDHFLLETADFTQKDITCLLPIGSGAASKNQMEAIFDTFHHSHHGIPETWKSVYELPEDLPVHVNILWNTLIIEGLADEGYPDIAKGLFTNLMTTVIDGLKHFDGFYPCYDSESGRPAGQRNAISGLLPLRLFLQIAGIRLFKPDLVAVWGENPFPWPVEIQWQGLTLRREGRDTEALFPDGSIYESDSTKPVLLNAGGTRS